MTRTERSEFTYIKNSLKNRGLGAGCQLTIRTGASSEYKKALHEHYTGLGFHPAAVRVDTRWFDENERIIYIHGLTFDLGGETRSWTELYTAEEKARFERALR